MALLKCVLDASVDRGSNEGISAWSTNFAVSTLYAAQSHCGVTADYVPNVSLPDFLALVEMINANSLLETTTSRGQGSWTAGPTGLQMCHETAEPVRPCSGGDDEARQEAGRH